MTSPEYKDYYVILDIPRDADEQTIKSAFRKQARTHHPDVNANKAEATEKFKEINEAYTVLSDPDKRARYDLSFPKARQGFGGAPNHASQSNDSPKRGQSARTSRPNSESNQQSTQGSNHDSSQGSRNQDSSEQTRRNDAGIRFPTVYDMLSETNQLKQFRELMSLVSKNNIAAEEIIPPLNLVLKAAWLWLEQEVIRYPFKRDLCSSIQKDLVTLFEELLNSKFMQGEEVILRYKDSLASSLFGVCCLMVNKIYCPVTAVLTPTINTIIFSRHQLSDSVNTAPPWQEAKDAYQSALRDSDATINHIQQAKNQIVMQTQFLRQTGTGLLDAYFVWLKKNNLNELSPVNSHLLLNAIDNCQEYFANTFNLSINDIKAYVNREMERFSQHCKGINTSTIILLQQALMRSFEVEFSAYSTITTNPILSPYGLMVEIHKLAKNGCPLREVVTFISAENRGKPEFFRVADWSEVSEILARLQAHVASNPAEPPNLFARMSRQLPRFLDIRNWFRLHYLSETGQAGEYLDFISKPQIPFGKKYNKWNEFERAINESDSSEEFRRFFQDRVIQAMNHKRSSTQQ